MSRDKRTMTDKYLVGRLWKYLLQSKRNLVLVLIIMVMIVGIEVYAPYHVSQILDRAIGDNDSDLLVLLALIYLGLMLFFNFLRWVGRLLFARIGETAVYNLRTDVFEKVLHHDQIYFDKIPTGETVSRLTNDIGNMQGILNGSVIFSLMSTFQILGYLIIMLNTSVSLTLVSIIIIPLSILSMWLNRKFIRTEVAIANKEVGEVSASITENIQGARVSAAFSRSEENANEFEEVNQRLGKTIYRLFRNVSVVGPLSRIFSFTTLLLVLYTGSRLISTGSGEITVGVLFLFMAYTQNFAQPVQQLSGVYNQIQNSFASFERIIKLIDEPTYVVDKEGALNLEVTQGEINLENITFHYTKDSEPVLENFSLLIHPGETIAVVGHTGAGKSTLTRIISRIYDIQSGEIRIDGQNIQNVTQGSLRESIGTVLQEPILFADSLRFNLTFGEDIEEGKLFEILDLVGADFVKSLPNGLDTVVGERGSRLSLGQRQLISFARALVPDPPILFLDEATSSIDPQAELRIQKAMDNMLKDRTSIMIAHRLSTVKKADRIIVMSNGKVIEEGSFSDLLALKGEFYELYQMQFNSVKEITM